ncbi:MAG: outer membrane lipoprotein-sorting protein [Proteobacteria bacterium]|nr:outer membrane lipoprotein-sorting protein [Pseudomonadota bacterium]
MRMIDRGKKLFFFIVMSNFLFLQGCGVLFLRDHDLKEFQIQKEQYEPYRLQNTIEGYREFIARFPKNLFVQNAQEQIENLEFAPYEEVNSIEGFIEFRIKFPKNRNISRTDIKIEQIETKYYDTVDTIEGYREFLSKYPVSTFALPAKERLQELEFRELDGVLQKQYGFDLLKYRLNLRRLKKDVDSEGGVNVGDFTCFASLATHEGKQYFHTNLIYTMDLPYGDAHAKDLSERIFDPIVSKALIYLDKHFKTKDEIDGFSFDVSSSAHRFYGDRKILLEYYFPKDQVNLFATDKLDKKDLFAQSMIVYPQKVVRLTKQAVKDAATPLQMDGYRIMTMVSERDTGRDYIISSSWDMVNGGGNRHTMKCIKKRENLRGENGFIDKTIIRYIEPSDQNGKVILIWNYKDRGKVYWYSEHPGDAKKVIDPERYRPVAETDFCLADYVDIKPGEERHTLLRNEGYEGKECYVVESISLNKEIKYGRRISWIDQRRWLPFKTEYYDKGGALWKTLKVEWQNKFGFWFWKKAVVENVQTGYKTLITTGDVRVNVGLQEKDFSAEGLVDGTPLFGQIKSVTCPQSLYHSES